MERNYRIADTVFSVRSLYERVHDYCKDYVTDEPAEIDIAITEEDIAYERSRSARTAEASGYAMSEKRSEYLEELAVYRKMAAALLDRDILLFHGSAVAVDGETYLFTAKSGTGKSTHTRLWREYFGERAVMVNDDKPLIYLPENGTPVIYGTPYNGKHRLGSNMSAPLKAVCILTRSENNHIEKISSSEAYALLLQQTNRPVEPSAMQKTMILVDRLADSTALYRLGCNMDISAAEVAYNGMK